MKRIIRSLGWLSILALVAGLAARVSAQTVGPSVAGSNVTAATAITLTGVNPTNLLIVPVVAESPGITLTMTNASVGTQHLGDTFATNAQADATALDTSLTAAVAGSNVIAIGGALPIAINALAGVNTLTAAANIVNAGPFTCTITGTPTSIVIIRAPGGFMTLTDVNIILAGGILAGNVYWQVNNAITVTNNDAVNRSFPGTALSQIDVTAGAVAVTSSGAGSLGIGRLISRVGGVTITQSGAGTLTVAFPSGGTGGFNPPINIPINICSAIDMIVPSPVTGATAQFSYCMDQPGTIKIRVYNAAGDLVAKIEDSKQSGAQLSKLNTARLAPGVYYYFLEKHYGGGTEFRGGVSKFVVVR
jgi:hypothetical protein